MDPDFEKVLFIGGPLHGTFHFLHKHIKSLSAVNSLSPYLVGGSKCQYYRRILVSPQKIMYTVFVPEFYDLKKAVVEAEKLIKAEENEDAN